MLPSGSTEALERLLTTLIEERLLPGESEDAQGENEDDQALRSLSRVILARSREPPDGADASENADDPGSGMTAAESSAAPTGSPAFLILQSEQAQPTIFFALPAGRVGSAVVGSDGMPSPMGAFSLSMGLEAALLQGLPTESGSANIMGGSMQSAVEHLLRIVVERSLEEQQRAPTVPPANETVRDSLPRVIVTKEDLMDTTNSKCSVCLDEFKAGLRVTRVFCGHLFCTSCIREWLRNANSCPICRFELATDCPEYEPGRKERMKDRKARLKEGELKVMRMPDLKKVMRALGVSGEGCLEKSDLLDRLKAAERVEVLPEKEETCMYEEAELRSLEMPLLLNLMERYRMAPISDDVDEDGERAEILQRFADAGRMRSASVRTESKTSTSSAPKGAPLPVSKPSTPRRRSSGTVSAPSAKAMPSSKSSSKQESGSSRRLSRGLSSENSSSSGASGSGQVRSPPDVRVRPSSAIRPSSSRSTGPISSRSMPLSK
jgi:hypothetical protein